MKKIFLIITTFFLSYFVVQSQVQNPFWTYFFNGNDVTSVVSIMNDSAIIIGTRESGIAFFNIDSMSFQGFLNKSTIPFLMTNNIRRIKKQGNDSIWICTDRGLIKLTPDSIIFFDTSNSGLLSNVINDISFDFLAGKWIATNSGLIYNIDTNWVIYSTQNSPLPNDEINFVKVDFLGNIWVGTPSGLAMFDRNNWYLWDINNSSLPDNFITFIEFDQSGSKWIGTLYGGLVHWVGNNMFVFDTTNSDLPSNSVLCFAFDTSGTKWIGTNNGLVHIGGSSGWEVFNTSNSKLSNNHINSIYISSDNKKFISTKDSLTIIIDTNFLVINVAVSDLPSNYIVKVVEQNSLLKWIATPSNLISYDGSHWTQYNIPDSVQQVNNIMDLALDVNNTLWIATDAGLYALKDNHWTSFFQDSLSLPSNNLIRVLPLGSNLWVGTDSGLAKFDINTNQWTRFDTAFGGLLRNRISALAVDTLNNLYIGLESLGLAILKSDTLVYYDANNSPLANFYISSLFVDDDQSLLIGTYGLGLVKLDSNWTIFNPDNSNFPDYAVKFITKSPDGWYWIATGTKGIVVFKDTTWIYINENNSPLANNVVNSIHFDFSNNKWLSTGNGLYVVNFDSLKPEIRTKPFSALLCADDFLLVDYYTFWNFNSNNEFQVLLSDSTGSFNNPILIGSYLGTVKSPILCHIPKFTSSGDNYRIKVISTNPPLDGSDNGFDISINTIAHPQIFGDTVACSQSIQKYWTEQIPLVAHIWRVEGGTILGSSFGDTILVRWDSVSGNRVILTATNQYNCSDSSSINVHLSSLPGKIIYGTIHSCVGDSYIYSTTDSTNITNIWSVVGGRLIKKLSNYSVIIRWDTVGTGIVNLRRINEFGCLDTVQLRVNVFDTPNANIFGPKEIMINSISIYKTTVSSPEISVRWRAYGGSILGSDNSDSVIIGWTKPGFGKVIVGQISANGCIDSSEYQVRIFEYSKIEGDTLVCEQTETYFETLSNLGATNQWSVVGGEFTSNPQNRRVWIKWGEPGIGQINLIQTYPSTTFKDTAIKVVIISPIPPKPVIADSGDFLISSSKFGNQWFLNGKPLFGDTNQVIFPLKTGYYSVQVTTAPACVSEMSDPVYFISSVEDDSKIVSLRPNPSTGLIYINILSGYPISRIIVLDEFGRKVKDFVSLGIGGSQELNLNDLTNGVYVLLIDSFSIIYRAKVILIK